MSISYRDFIHPEDAKAIQIVKGIPGYEELAQWVVKVGIEQYYHSTFMAEHVRLSPKQLPKIYSLLPPVCRKFGIDEPEFYLQMDPNPGAFTVGDRKACIVITSGLLDCITDPVELQSIIAHECGHIVCRHTVYLSLLHILLCGDFGPLGSIGKGVASDAVAVAETIPVVGTGVKIAGIITAHAYVALLAAFSYWARRSELSCDRASAVFACNAEIPARALLRLVAGPSRFTSDIDFREYANQVNDRAYNTKWQTLLRGAKIAFKDHPFSTVRVNEIVKFSETKRFGEIVDFVRESGLGHICVKCGKPITPGQKFCRFCGTRIDKAS